MGKNLNDVLELILAKQEENRENRRNARYRLETADNLKFYTEREKIRLEMSWLDESFHELRDIENILRPIMKENGFAHEMGLTKESDNDNAQ